MVGKSVPSIGEPHVTLGKVPYSRILNPISSQRNSLSHREYGPRYLKVILTQQKYTTQFNFSLTL